jgi:hypothetical protein
LFLSPTCCSIALADTPTADELVANFIGRHEWYHAEALHVTCRQICDRFYVSIFHFAKSNAGEMGRGRHLIVSDHTRKGHVARHVGELDVDQLGHVQRAMEVSKRE